MVVPGSLAAPPGHHGTRLAVPTAFRNTRNAALSRAKDGEGRASAVEPIFGNLIDSLHMKRSPNCWRRRRPGRREWRAKIQ